MADLIELGDLPKDHMSETSRAMWLRCPRQYEYRYVKGMKSPPSSPLVLGRAAHSALEWDWTEHLAQSRHPASAKLLTRYEYELGQSERAVQEDAKQEIEWKEGDNHAVLLDDGTRLLKEYDGGPAKAITPVAVEKPFRYGFANVSYAFEGRIDLVTTDKAVVDYKTCARKQPDGAAGWSDQLTGYQIALENEGKTIKTCEIHALVRTKKTATVQILSAFPRNAQQKKDYLDSVGMIALAIRAGIFPPTNDVAGTCSWCGFARICRSEVYEYFKAKREQP